MIGAMIALTAPAGAQATEEPPDAVFVEPIADSPAWARGRID